VELLRQSVCFRRCGEKRFEQKSSIVPGILSHSIKLNFYRSLSRMLAILEQYGVCAESVFQGPPHYLFFL
jgi:hypothetical protein